VKATTMAAASPAERIEHFFRTFRWRAFLT
jgi:hypothetical protein